MSFDTPGLISDDAKQTAENILNIQAVQMAVCSSDWPFIC
jgi:hypothetical protein